MRCPKCNREFSERSAISRIDGSDICPLCGTKEAIDDAVKANMMTREDADTIIACVENYQK